MRSFSEMRPYQKRIANLARGMRAAGVFLKPGYGKSVVTLKVLDDLRRAGLIRKVLVAGPVRVAKHVWPDELKEWKETADWPVSIACGSAAERLRALRRDAFIYTINKENLAWLTEQDFEFDVLVVDEASFLRNARRKTPKGKPTQFGAIVLLSKRARRLYELTGTPTPQSLENIWGVVYPLDGGERLGKSKHAFLQRWFYQGRTVWQHHLRPNAAEEIAKRIADITLTVADDEVLQLPQMLTTPDTDIVIRFPPELMKEYKRFERTLFLDQHEITAVSAGVLVNKLLQFASGFVYDDRGEAKFIHDLKTPALLELLDELNGDPLLLAYNFKEERNRIAKALKLGKKIAFVGDKDWLKRWNDGALSVLASHTQSISHGMNLQFGGSHVCHYSTAHSAENYTQINARLHRSGQTAERTYVHHIFAKGTWDEKVVRNKDPKAKSEESLIQQIRNHAARLRRV